eukprot:Transcript_21855.p1 GENE.Transcript_21855~~Transcript_21855.p1  ORF type:complete len:439 (-),score=109.08 Transcript_21855:742-1941(-)
MATRMPLMPLRASCLTMEEPSPSDRLASLEKTLNGLQEEGYGDELLEPLRREIKALKAEVAPSAQKEPEPFTGIREVVLDDQGKPQAVERRRPPPSGVDTPAPSPNVIKPFDPNADAAPPTAPASEVFAGMKEPIPLDGSPPPPAIKPFDPDEPAAPPSPAAVRPFDPDADAAAPSAPPAPPERRLSAMQQLRAQTQTGYMPPTGINPAAELLQRREEERRERGEDRRGGGGGGSGTPPPIFGGFFGSLGLSPEQRQARDAARAAAAEERRADAEQVRQEMLAQAQARRQQAAEVQQAREQAEAERIATRERTLKAERELVSMVKRATKNLEVGLETYKFSGSKRREDIDAEGRSCLQALPGLIEAADSLGIEALAGAVDGARQVLARLEEAARGRAAL